MQCSKFKYPGTVVSTGDARVVNNESAETVERLEYLLDQDNIITAIEGEWDEFAINNGGIAVLAEDVIGQPLCNYISGKVTKQHWLNFFEHVRTSKRSASLDFRCDAPLLKRFMRITAIPDVNGQLRILSELLRSEPTVRQVLLSASAQRSKYTLVRCSQCNRLLHQGLWQEAGEVSQAKACWHWQVTYGICPDCQQLLTLATKKLLK